MEIIRIQVPAEAHTTAMHDDCWDGHMGREAELVPTTPNYLISHEVNSTYSLQPTDSYSK